MEQVTAPHPNYREDFYIVSPGDESNVSMDVNVNVAINSMRHFAVI